MVLAGAHLLNPFVRGAFLVLESFGVPAERSGGPSIQSGDDTTEAVTIIVPIVGALEGVVFYGFDYATAERLAGVMLDDMRAVRWDDQLVQSALGEFGNMVSGQASAQLESEGIRCNIAPPVIALQSRLIVANQPFERLVVSIATSLGPVKIHLALHDTRMRT